MIRREYKTFGFCCGLGGGAKGFKRAASRVGNMVATWRCIGGIDVDPAAARDFETLVGVPCTVMDLFTRQQYTAFWGKEPPAGRREATPVDIRRAAGNERPHCVFISSPCEGASGLLSEALSRKPKYQALNELTLRCVWLMCEAWKDNPSWRRHQRARHRPVCAGSARLDGLRRRGKYRITGYDEPASTSQRPHLLGGQFKGAGRGI